jgi:hypothetical protein
MKNTLFTRIFENQILLLSVIVRVETGHRTGRENFGPGFSKNVRIRNTDYHPLANVSPSCLYFSYPFAINHSLLPLIILFFNFPATMARGPLFYCKSPFGPNDRVNYLN